MDINGEKGQRKDELVEFVSGITDSARLKVEENLAHGFVRLKVAEAELRQAQHDIQTVEDIVVELVRNSRDAGASRILVASQKKESRYRNIIVIDDGIGIHPEMHQLVFEPRVTSRLNHYESDRFGVHGRGMALFSIKTRVDKAEVVYSEPGVGTVLNVKVDTNVVPERSDQASLPRLKVENGEFIIGAGPHNIQRKLIEFSIDHPDIDFFFGSFSEIVATLYMLALNDREVFKTPWSMLSRLKDAKSLVDFSHESLRAKISERNAYRIVNRDIEPLQTITERLKMTLNDSTDVDGDVIKMTSPVNNLRKNRRNRNPVKRISVEDIEEIRESVSDSVETVLRRYYLRTSRPPLVRRGKGKITVSFYISDDEGDRDWISR